MRLLIAGSPGSGKGTQSRYLSGALRIPHVSTGDLLRDAIRLGTPLGYGATECIAEGRLAPDRVVNEMVWARLSRSDTRERGFLLDGFPRNVDQLDSLVSWLAPDALDAAVQLVIPTEVAVRRLEDRGRDDDAPRAIAERLDAFEGETAVLLRELDSRGLLISIDADRPIALVTASILDALRVSGRHADHGVTKVRVAR